MTVTEQGGQIITFYSYKGGTGRSMALANTAWILASNGYRVLAVDWDLESPGLHRYLHPFLIDKALQSSRGTIDLIWDFASAAMSHEEAGESGREVGEDWVANRAVIERYAVSLDWEFPDRGTFDFVPTGRQDTAYSRRVSGIDWERLYQRQGGGDFFARLRENMKSTYDFVLIDSRTGFSDTGAICTVALPDVVVDCFTLSSQSISGAYSAAVSIRENSRSRHIRILPVPMRVEDAETSKLEMGRDDARRTFEPFLAHLDHASRERYWGDVEIPYKPFYAYEEILATIGDRPRQENSLLAFYERLARTVTEGRVSELVPMDEGDRRQWLAQFERVKRVLPSDIFISHVEQDRMWADWIAYQLESVGYRVALQGTSLPPGADLETELRQTIRSSACTLAVMSPDYLDSQSARHTWEAAFARSPSGWQGLLVPVLVSKFRPWGVFSSRVPVDIATLEASEAREELLAAVREPGLLPSQNGPGVEADSENAPRFPGAEPTVSNLPNRNPHFVGRDPLLLDLRQRLLNATTAVVVPQALHGLGGVGKTQVAMEYAHRFGADYDLVWWLPAEQPSEARSRIAALAPHLNLGSAGDEPGEVDRAVRSVLDALRRGDPYRRWLLIFDNADEPDELETLLPTGPGHVIVTSRNQGWASEAQTVEVDVFAREESISLLQRRGRNLSVHDSDRLAERLGDLPLALEQAAVWQAETGMSVDEYLQLFDERLEQLLASGSPQLYSTSVAATWSIVFDRLRVQSPAAVQMLELCAFFGPEPIPFRLLSLGRFTALPEPLASTISDSILRRRAVREIGRYALAQVDPAKDTLQVHRLVQAVLREGLTPEQRASYLSNAHELMAAANPGAPDNRRTWALHAELSPHLGPAKVIDGGHDKIRKVVLDQIRYRYRRGDMSGSRDLAEQTYTRWTETIGPDDAQTLVASRFLATALRWSGDSERARKLNEEAIVRLTRRFGQDHEHTLATRNLIGANLRDLGRFAEAKELDQDNLVRHRRVYGDDAPETLLCSHNLAVDLRLLGDFEDARRQDEDTLRRRLRVLEPEDSYILSSTANLARDLLNLGDFRGAQAMLEAALAEFRPLLTPDHVEILSASRAYAVALRMVGDYDAARRSMEENHALHTARFGPGHQLTLDTMISVGNNRRAAGDLAGARAITEETLKRSVQVLGVEHPFTQAAAVNLAVVLRGVGQIDRSRSLVSEAYLVLERTLGADHYFTITTGANQATAFAAVAEHSAAREWSENVFERARRIRGEDHPDTLGFAVNLALDLQSTGSPAGPTRLQEAVARMRQVLGDAHPVTQAAAAGRRGEFDIETPPT
ncbi:FxSxx-COOH system tetratricopeptide repeat protein [Kineosporia babensis]|uniref:FxSxx-COOH system tetratricopeptide repeat protein n=1 Tax=Kineosporia babensis TaxID=499548 RepID=A0A9X1NJ55_9ACTN|nr:FxSxx-COOH system tetratricopeptide repeat protein [Kineosporia babensis]MCD5315035.1 FxSxx-COOH system tetratricopeptide repeat protein [Kineosporia babensis]